MREDGRQITSSDYTCVESLCVCLKQSLVKTQTIQKILNFALLKKKKKKRTETMHVLSQL